MEHVVTSNRENLRDVMTIKNEEPDGELENIAMKEELIDWNQKPQIFSNAVFSTCTTKGEVDEVTAEIRPEQAEVEDKLMRGCSGVYNSRTILQRTAETSQASTCSRHRAGKHGIGELLTCELCEYSSADGTTMRRHFANTKLQQHLAGKHGTGKSLKE
ncbi:hypothetical protein FHG87_022144 [Trinorchestia longiramus]|nr:hypothetical protein FHG87_022144 [Trinorchestia longiramus]